MLCIPNNIKNATQKGYSKFPSAETVNKINNIEHAKIHNLI